MKLTSYNRMIRYLAAQDGANKTSNTYTKRDIETWISAVSKSIENHLSRGLELKYREEYFDVLSRNQVEYFVSSYPIVSISYVNVDSGGQHTTTNLIDADDYFPSVYQDSVVMTYAEGYKASRGIKIGYTGGLAEHGYQSVYTLSSISGTILTNHFVLGDDSNALGLVKDISGTTLTTEILYGSFDVGEGLTFATTEDNATPISITATLESKTLESMAEKYPDLTAAAETEVRYMWKHKHDFENSSSQKDGTTVRAQTRDFGLQPQTLKFLFHYKRLH